MEDWEQDPFKTIETEWDEETRRAYEQYILHEMAEEVDQEHFLGKECVYVSFVSRSNGKGRKRKKWREIEFLVYRGKTYLLPKDLTGEIEWIMKSLFPEERIPERFGNDWYGAFIDALRNMPRIKKGKTSKGTFTERTT